MEAAAEFISTKFRVKRRIPWEILAVTKKRDDVKTASLCNRRNPTNANAQKLKNAQRELTNAYLRKQAEYIQDQINKIRHSVADRQFRIAWQRVKEVSRWKSTTRGKLKERIHLWKEHLKICAENPPKLRMNLSRKL